MASSTKPQQINPVDELIPLIGKAVEEWKQENTAISIAQNVKELLNKNSKEITMKLLGFDSRYDNGWSLDHCNGRSGNSIAGDFLFKNQAVAIQEWLGNIKMPTMTPSFKAELEKEMQRDYESEMHSHVRGLIREKAKGDLKTLIGLITESNSINNHIKMLRLIEDVPVTT